MSAKPAALSLPDALGPGRLAIDAADGRTALPEHLHMSILETPAIAALGQGVTGGVTRLVYRGLHGAIRLTGAGVGGAVALVRAKPDDRPASRRRDAALAALNGLVGDHLAKTGNPLALTIQFRRDGRALALGRRALAQAFPHVTRKLAVLAHGLCMSDLQWTRANHDHGAALARDLGYTPIYLSYNSGLHISVNGRAFAEALEALVAAWPVDIEDFIAIGHSMAGLVARSACAYGEEAGHQWRQKLRKLVFLGTPHHGAPLERIGNWVDETLGQMPYGAAFGRFGKVRSSASPTCATGTSWTKIGGTAIASPAIRTRAAPFPCPKASPATRSPPRQLVPSAASRTASSATASSPSQARWAVTGSRRGRSTFPSAGNGSHAKRGTWIC